MAINLLVTNCIDDLRCMENKNTNQTHEEELEPVKAESTENDESVENFVENPDNQIEENKNDVDWESKYKEIYDQYLRLFSEFDNFRKRNTRERIELIKTAGSEILAGVLPVLDDFDRALKTMDSATADVASLKTGVDMIFQKLLHVLQEKGLQPYNPIGEKFDPDLHEAISHIPAQDEAQKGLIIDVVEKGYKMHEKVLRYPKVIVAQ